jgi:transcription regulator MmyB-like protein
VQRILDAMTHAPAYLRNGRGDILAANQLGRALYSELYNGATGPVNTARFVFLDPRAPHFLVDWDKVADDVVATLRSEAGRDPHDPLLSELVGDLSLQSPEFRTRWGAHNVRIHDRGTKRLHHPVVGDLTLSYETMQLTADSELTIAVYTAEPGSSSEEALNLLASWTATLAAEAHTPDLIDPRRRLLPPRAPRAGQNASRAVNRAVGQPLLHPSRPTRRWGRSGRLELRGLSSSLILAAPRAGQVRIGGSRRRRRSGRRR